MDSHPQSQTVDWQNDPEFINLSAIAAFIRTHLKSLSIAFGVSAVIGVGVALIVPLEFTATASILPSESASPMARLASQFGGIPGLGGAGSKSMVELYPQIARSQTVLTGMLDTAYRDSTFRYALAQEIDSDETDTTKLEDELMRHLRKELSASLDPVNSFITISFTAHDPVFAADLVNEVVRRMDEFLRDRLHTESNDQSDLITRRLAEEAELLRQAEERLLDFREKNRAALSPAALMEQTRLMREVEIHNALYVELTKQLEVARIDAYRNAPVLTVLDWAVPPVKKSGPKRSMYVLGIVFVGVVGTAGWMKYRGRKRESES